MNKRLISCLLLLAVLLSACAVPTPSAFVGTPGNLSDYTAPTFTPRPIPTPLPKSEGGEVTLLLRKRTAPYEVLILRLPTECLLGKEACDVNGNLLGVLPQSLSQVLRVYWMKDGSQALFWDDNTGDIYLLDGSRGVFSVFKKGISKVRSDFFVSPDGKHTLFEVQKSNDETDLVLMTNSSGDILSLDVPLPGMKYVSQWVDDTTILFWNEVVKGKGYLVDFGVYTLNIADRSLKPFVSGQQGTQNYVPIFSPDRKFMALAAGDHTIIRGAATLFEHAWAIQSERLLWSRDSAFLAMYSPDKEIYVGSSDGGDLQKVYSFGTAENLEDWIWLTDSQHILLVAVDEDGNRQIGTLSVADKAFTPLPLSLLNDYYPVSLSFRP